MESTQVVRTTTIRAARNIDGKITYGDEYLAFIDSAGDANILDDSGNQLWLLKGNADFVLGGNPVPEEGAEPETQEPSLIDTFDAVYEAVNEDPMTLQPAPQGALQTQIGGDHYKSLPIQPMEYSMANRLDACQHTIVKYVTRFREKGGLQDLEKAKHCIDLLMDFERRFRPEM